MTEHSDYTHLEPAMVIEELRQQNEHLKSQLMNTSLINELTRVLHSCGDLNGIIKTVLLAIQEIGEFDRAILFEIDKKNFVLKLQSWVGIEGMTRDTLSIPLGFEGGEITDALFLNRHIIVEKPDPASDPFSTVLHSPSYVVIPLISRVTKRCWEAKSCTLTNCPAHSGFNPYCWSIIGAGLLANTPTEDEKRKSCVECTCFKGSGVFWVDRNKHLREVTSDDITTLTAIVNLAGIIIENFRILNDLDTANNNLHRVNNQLKVVNHDLQIAQSRIKADLDHARTIQLGLLPQDLDTTSAFPVGARYLSADAVGGDYYDFFETSPGIYSLIVADVSGHGIASALIMSMVKMLLKTFAAEEQSPQKTLERINTAFQSDVKTDNFVTIFYAIVNTNEKTIRYTSAGHCPIFVIDRVKKTCFPIKADGLFLGVFPDMMLNESTMKYDHGNHRIVLYTDGLTEAKKKESDEMYGAARLQETIMATLTKTPKQSIDAILADQKLFCGPDAPVEDDITLLIIDL
ncbi:MAG: serine/threonine-protein phosphatase [Chitinispirillaceae bacterium]|nr:serine/threonine-protein phosphatase [Chitinispirillaceae bacterium]